MRVRVVPANELSSASLRASDYVDKDEIEEVKRIAESLEKNLKDGYEGYANKIEFECKALKIVHDVNNSPLAGRGWIEVTFLKTKDKTVIKVKNGRGNVLKTITLGADSD